jgi:SOS-response transcriptional repressor LexA
VTAKLGTAPDALTSRQRDLLLAIEAYYDEHGVYPTYLEMSRAIGLTSPNGAYFLTAALIRKGYLVRANGDYGPRARPWRVVRRASEADLSVTPTRQGFRLSLPGRPLSGDELRTLSGAIRKALEED